MQIMTVLATYIHSLPLLFTLKHMNTPNTLETSQSKNMS